ncbi:hypothetical protein IPG41_02550 [Candidatus Peregrinibacteria bacterium]|nr:MAG: hypothetical protein IPG41_02550 [Candidatus Peregrinibacteria bacterium]
MTDQELYEKARLYGKNALLWRQKFMGLLPEIQKRRLYEKKGFDSIFEFAFRLAGLSEQQVRTVLNLEKRFQDKPILKGLLENGEVSVNKLVRIQSIATSQNEAALAQAVQLLPQKALETFVRDERVDTAPNESKSLRAQSLQLNDEVKIKLLLLQEKGVDVNELLLDFLERRDQDIFEEKEACRANLLPAKSRAIPVQIKKIVEKEHGTKCSIQTCFKSAEQIHHTQTFALSRCHDPHYLAPLCKEHHVIAHAINLKVQEKRRSFSLQT